MQKSVYEIKRNAYVDYVSKYEVDNKLTIIARKSIQLIPTMNKRLPITIRRRKKRRDGPFLQKGYTDINGSNTRQPGM